MAQSSAGHSIEDIYRGVINDVMNHIKEAFLDENVDVDVLAQLKQLWENKLRASGAVDLDGPKSLAPPSMRMSQAQRTGGVININRSSAPSSTSTPVITSVSAQNNANAQLLLLQQQQQQQQETNNIQEHSINNISQLANSANTDFFQQNALLASGVQLPSGFRLVSTTPGANANRGVAQYAILPGGSGNGQNIFMIPTGGGAPQALPFNIGALAQLSSTSSTAVDATRRGLSNPTVAAVQPSGASASPLTQPQQHPPTLRQAKAEPGINQLDGTGGVVSCCAGNSEQFHDLPSMHSNFSSRNVLDSKHVIKSVSASNGGTSSSSKSLTPLKPKSQIKRISQLDGGAPGMSDSSTSEEEEEDDDAAMDKLRRFQSLENEKLEDGDGDDEDPLNSNDDQSDDEDLETLFDADNIVVCQFEKVHRARNKWKFTLKDGIMRIDGKEYCFQKCSGEAEW